MLTELPLPPKLIQDAIVRRLIYELEVLADQPTNKIVQNRKGIIGDLMYAIMTKAFFFLSKTVLGSAFSNHD